MENNTIGNKTLGPKKAKPPLARLAEGAKRGETPKP